MKAQIGNLNAMMMASFSEVICKRRIARDLQTSERNLRLVFGVIILFMLPMGVRAQNTYYVSKDGDDANPCSQARPCHKIERTVPKLSAGDTLIIKAGKYKDVLNDIVPSGTSWTRPVTIKANPGDRVVLLPKPSRNPNRVLYFAYPDTSYIIVDGLIIDARNTQLEGIKITTGAHHIRIQNCEIRNAPTMGILITDPGSTDNEIINCKIHDVGSSTQLDHALYITTGHNLVEGCRIYDALSHGIHLYGDPGMDKNVFRNNTIYNCKRGMGIYGGSNNEIYNNVIYDHSEYGILLRSDAGDLQGTRIYNNTIYNSGNVGIYNRSTSGSGTLIRNNLVFDHATDIQDDTGTAVVETNLVNSDPRFVDLAGKDFHLKSGSPAIDAGMPVAEVTVDIEGTVRPQGAGYDLGAYEAVPARIQAAGSLSGEEDHSPVIVREGKWGVTLASITGLIAVVLIFRYVNHWFRHKGQLRSWVL